MKGIINNKYSKNKNIAIAISIIKEGSENNIKNALSGLFMKPFISINHINMNHSILPIMIWVVIKYSNVGKTTCNPWFLKNTQQYSILSKIPGLISFIQYLNKK